MYRSRHSLALCALFLGLFVLAGCGTGAAPVAETEPAPSETTEPARPQTAEERLAGQWHGQMILDEEVAKQLPAIKVAKLREMEMGMEFRPDGTLILVGVKDDGTPAQSEGTWSFVKADGDNVTIKTVEAGGKKTDAVLMFDGDDAFLMPVKTEVANLGAFRFERLR